MSAIATVEWIPLADYHGANHVLGAGACCIHPGNGNQYFWDCVQWSGARQDLNIYRIVAKTGAFEHVVKFEGTIDAERGFERGQGFIGQGGALVIATTMTPKGVPHVTTTGFQGVWCRIPGIDEPWNFAYVRENEAQLDALADEVAELKRQLGTPGPKGPKGDTGAQGVPGEKGSGGADTAALENLTRIVEKQAQTITAIELALGNLTSGGMSPDVAELLAWVGALRDTIHRA